MKKSIKLILLCVCAALCLTLFAASALAVPAAPGSGREGQEAACRSHTGKLITLDDIPDRGVPKGTRAFIPALQHTTKNIPLLTVVIGFPNVPYHDDYDWNEAFFSGEKSITSYYSDMSFGKFTFLPAQETCAYGGANTNRADKAGDGVIHVTLDTPHYDWSMNYGLFSQRKDRKLALQMVNAFKAALEKASDYIDFAAYDEDGNGTIESTELALSFVVAGYEGAYLESYDTVGVEKVLWAHASNLVALIEEYGFDVVNPQPDGVTVSEYIAVAEELEPGLQQPISTVAHELGHYLGLPDLYDSAYLTGAQWSSYFIDTASIMCSGWGYDPDTEGFAPYSMDVWSRYRLGWVEPVTADATGVYDVVTQSYTADDAFTAVMVPTQKAGEYYLLENRQPTKWDAGMTTSYEGSSRIHGIMLWHIDETAYEQYQELNAVNTANHRPAVMPLFPEEEKGVVTFTGVGTVYNGNPFYDRTYCIEKLELADAAVDLPLYGTGNMADQRIGRWSSGIRVEFLDDSAADMRVRVDRDNMAQLADENECMYCHKVHTGFFGNIVAYFHRIFYVLRSLFGR